MATLEVNKHPVNLDSSKYLNLKSLLPKLQKEFPFDVYTLAYFKVNGHAIDVNSEDPILVRPINNNDKIEITFDRRNTFMADIINETHELVDKIIEQILVISTIMQDEDNNERYPQKLPKVIQAVDTFIKSISFITKESSKLISNYPELPFKELHIHLLSVMKAIDAAQKSEDHIMLADLLEYELKDNLTQWKILIMPTLRKQVQISL